MAVAVDTATHAFVVVLQLLQMLLSRFWSFLVFCLETILLYFAVVVASSSQSAQTSHVRVVGLTLLTLSG